MSTRHRRLTLVLVMLVAATSATSAGERDETDAAAVRFLVPKTTVELGRTRVVHFRHPRDAASHDAAAIDDPSILGLAGGPWTSDEADALGVVRVRGLSSGQARLTIGDASIDVVVVESGVQLASEGDVASAPRIIGPATGAVVWGKIAVGVEERIDGQSTLRPILVYVGNQMVLLPDGDTGTTWLPERHLRFTLDADALAEGVVELRPVAVTASGAERHGPVVRVQVTRPFADKITAGEAERQYELPGGSPFGNQLPGVGRDREASGGLYVEHRTPIPPIAFPVEARVPGWYQLVVVARGTRAKSALPVIAVVVDGSMDFVTNGRVLDERWHRLAVGIPFRLEAGRHAISPLFANDLQIEGLADRDLHLDRLEVARVAYVDPRLDEILRPASVEARDPAATETQAALADPFGLASEPLRISLEPTPRAADVPGVIEITAGIAWAGSPEDTAPVVTALVDGAAVARQRSYAPRFWIDPSAIDAEGANVQLVARSDQGPVAATPRRRLERAATAPGSPRRCVRFTVHDERWQRELVDLPSEPFDVPERRVFRFTERRAAVLELPVELDGLFDVFLEACATSSEQTPEMSVSLFDAAGLTPLGRVALDDVWRTRRIGTATVRPGPKRLVVRFERRGDGDGDAGASVLMQSLIVAERPADDDRTPPVAALVHPAPATAVFGADAVVVDAADDVLLHRAELLVDGHATGQTVGLSGAADRVVIPLLARTLAPGEHVVAARVHDAAGNVTQTAAHTITVTDAPPAVPGRYERAVRMLDRFAFGPDAEALGSILSAADDGWLEQSLRRSLEASDDLVVLGGSLRRFPGLEPEQVVGRVLDHVLRTPNPARARLVLWTGNHFSTWIRKTGGESKWAEHVTFARLGGSRFDRLLLASAQSPAMLAYLDQVESYAGRLNENYAREIMELHTLGVDGGYDQDDVTSLAHLLTGWTTSLDGDGRSGGAAGRLQAFRFVPRLNDERATRVLGLELPEAAAPDRYDRAVLAIEHLAAHPSTARTVARKLAEHYEKAPASEALVDELAQVFMTSGGDLVAMLAVIADRETTRAVAPRRLARPLDYVVRLLRIIGRDDPQRAASFLATSGTGLFDRATPDGYPDEDAEYADSNAMVQRWRLALELGDGLAGLVPPAWRDGTASIGGSWEQAIVDVLAVRLTGRLLPERSNRAALDVIAARDGSPEQRIAVVAPFIAQLPEANLR